MKVLQPPGWSRPKGYSNGIVAEGRQVFVAGQVGWDPQERMVEGGFAAQARQALLNIVAILGEAGAAPEHLTRMTWYVTDKQAYTDAGKEVGQAYTEIIGSHYPAMTLVVVAGLIEEGALVEVEATAVIP